MLDAERTWDIQKGDPSVVVAVLDTGIAYEDFGPYRKAPDFGGTVFVPGYNVITDDEPRQRRQLPRHPRGLHHRARRPTTASA